MKLYSQLIITCVFLFVFSGTAALAFGGASQQGGGAAPTLSGDLSVTLHVPLFDPEFADLPVASIGAKTLLLKELTPSLEASSHILFWKWEPSAKKLSGQFKQALDARIAQEQAGPEQVIMYVEEQIIEGPMLTLHAPLFLELFADTPVALVNGTPVTVAEFSENIQAVHSEVNAGDAPSNSTKNVQLVIERLITSRLVEQEARNIGFDQTSTFNKQVAAFAEKKLLYSLLDNVVKGLSLDEKAAQVLYRKISLEAKLISYRFALEKDATDFLAAYKAGKHFETLAVEATAQKIAVTEDQQGYTKLKDLLPNIAAEADTLEIGAVSQIFRQADGFILFKLEDRRFVEDSHALQFARKDVWKKQTANAGAKYITETIQRYAVYNQEVRDDVDFTKLKAGKPDIQLGEALQPLLKDERVLVSVGEAESGSITVAELAKAVKGKFFHGVDIPLDAAGTDSIKDDILQDKLFRMAGTLEAKKMGLDQKGEYLNAVTEFERGLLFDIFMQKVVTPEVQFSEAEVKEYYYNHLEDNLTPMMLRVKSLPFNAEKDALKAAEKLRNGSDFKWVSANAEGLVDIQDKNLLQFDRNILSLTSLPPDLQQQAAAVVRGDSLVYAEPDSYYYVLYLEDVYPPEAKPYDQVRDDILKVLYQQKTKRNLEEWVSKLKEAYETRVFLEVEGRG